MVTPAGSRLAVTDPPIPEDDTLWTPPGSNGMEIEVAVVEAVGADCTLGVEAGDRVHFHAGHFAKIGDVKIIDEACVLAFEKR